MLHIVERIAKLGLDLPLSSDEGVGDVFQEDQAEHGMLVNGSVEIGAESVGGGPELLVEVAEKLLGVGGHARKSRFSYHATGAPGRSNRSASAAQLIEEKLTKNWPSDNQFHAPASPFGTPRFSTGTERLAS